MVANIPPPKMPPLPGLGNAQGVGPQKMPPPEVQQAINMASVVTHANGLLATLALEEIAELRRELKLAPMDLHASADDLEVLPQEFVNQAHPAMVAFEKQARAIAAAKLRMMADNQDKG